MGDNDIVSNWTATIADPPLPRYEGGYQDPHMVSTCGGGSGVASTVGAGGVYYVEEGGVSIGHIEVQVVHAKRGIKLFFKCSQFE